MTMVDDKVSFDNQRVFKVEKTYTVTLSEPNVATDAAGNKGTWTMIYDEGFEVVINNQKFFTFFRYEPKPSVADPQPDKNEDFISFCDETFTGWFHTVEDTNWGCYIGKRTSAPARAPLGQSHSFKSLRMRDHDDERDGEVSSFSEVSARRRTPADDDLFTADASFIETVNSDKERTWTATAHKQFEGMRIGDMMKMLGRTKFMKSVNPPDGLQLDNRPDDVKYAGLPAEYDLRKVRPQAMTPIVSQGSCGSCYAIAAADAMSIRLKMQQPDAPKLSPQNVVSCSDYNQGCEGGYPFLVGKFGEDIGFVPEYCQPYTGADDACTVNCPADKPLKVYHATNYGYIGGYYGACNEVAMMHELHKNGPIVIALNAPPDLFYYSGGIYSFTDTDKANSNLNGVSRWEKTNHAVLCVGWGVENGVKYWM
eukprot:g6351.t1